MRNIVVRMAMAGLASVGISSTAHADSIAVSAGLLETPVAGISELGSAVRIGPPGLGLAGTLTSALAQFQPTRDFSTMGRAGSSPRGRQSAVASRTYGSGMAGMGGGLGRRGHGQLEFRGSGSLGEDLRPSAAVPSLFTLTGPPSHGHPATPAASRSSSTPAVVVQHVNLPLPVAGAVGAVGPRSDFAGAPGEPTPEPATLVLLAGGLGAAILHRRRRMKAAS